MEEHTVLLAAALFAVALLYSSVGHAGASGYIAAMALFGIGIEAIRPAALALNILVASIGAVQWWRAGHFSWRLFRPFALVSVPAAFLGGWIHVAAEHLKLLIGLVLWFSAWRLLWRQSDPAATAPPKHHVAVATGAGIGLLSGLTGTGGGIFLTPLLLFCRWAKTKEAAAISPLFILLNSSAGLAGLIGSGRELPALAWPLAAAVAAGGLIGSRLGSRHIPARGIGILLAAVLAVAGSKLVFG